ncbi:hypothetical protein INR49_000342, partial [Caranx melampygus]
VSSLRFTLFAVECLTLQPPAANGVGGKTTLIRRSRYWVIVQLLFHKVAVVATHYNDYIPTVTEFYHSFQSTSPVFNMSAKDTLRRNKTDIQTCLCGDHRQILNKVYEKGLITQREYNNLKSINKEDVEGHVVELVDKIMNKGDKSCQDFLNLLQTDEDIKTTYPELKNIQLNDAWLLPKPTQACSSDSNDASPESKRQKREEQYQLKSQPVGLCVIINNENFMDGTTRSGTNKDAESLAGVFSWLGFRVLMFKDQTQDQMDRTLKCFASLSDPSQLQEFNVKEWLGIEFIDLQQVPKHGDAFICCILSHGKQSVVLGTDMKPLPIKQITRTFKATDQSALTSKPKLFFVQACQGGGMQHGVLFKDLESDNSQSVIPEDADVLVAIATVEDHVSFRHKTEGSWFIQSVCQQLQEGCPRHEDIITILHRVNNDVSQKEASSKPGERKQMPEIKSTLRKKLVLRQVCYLPYIKTAQTMEDHLEDETPVGALAGTGAPRHGEELKASNEAIAFMSSTEPAELLKCVFPDSLATVSEGGRDLGKFTVTVEFARRVQQTCMLLHAQSQGAIDGSPCGTTVTAYLTTDLEVLEEDYHEYVKLEGHSLDKRCYMVQRDGQMVIDKVITVGEEVTKETVSYPMSVLRGLVTEGSILLLMRLIALRKKMPEHMTFISFDQGLHITHTTFVSVHTEVGPKQLEVGGETVEVYGVERIAHSVEDSPTTWQCYFLDDGHLVSRVQVGSPVAMRLLQLPSQLEKDFEKIPLVWEEDMQMHSKFLDRKVKDAKGLFLRLQEYNLLDDGVFLSELLHTINRADLLSLLETDSRRIEGTEERPTLSAYRKMLYQIYDDMTLENLEKMKFLLNSKLGRRQIEACTTALDLFAEMEKADILSKNKLHELHAVLKEFDQQLAQTVQRFMDGTAQQDQRPARPPVSMDSQLEKRWFTRMHNQPFSRPLFMMSCSGVSVRRLGFTVVIRDNLHAANIKHELGELGKRNFLEHDALVVCVLSHGEQGCIFGTDEKKVTLRELTLPFTSGNAPTLAGKPKLFFIQACQGGSFQEGSVPCPPRPQDEAMDRQIRLEEDAGPVRGETVASDADFLVGMATVPECKSFRNTSTGSIYIQELCRQLIRSAESSEFDDILTVLTRVNREVGKGEYLKHKQMPQPHYTLTKKLVLKFV